MENKTFKVAFTTDDSTAISPHFGRANYFEVLQITNGSVTSRETRDKALFHGNHNENNLPDHGERHKAIYESIQDCDYVVSGNMGQGIYDFLIENNKKPIITNIRNIEDALAQIITGTIENQLDKLH